MSAPRTPAALSTEIGASRGSSDSRDMTKLSPSPGWQGRVASALGLVLAASVVARAMEWLLAPVVPFAVVGVCLLGLYALAFRGFRR